MGHLPDQGLTLFYELYFRWNEEQDALELEAAQQRETLHVQATA